MILSRLFPDPFHTQTLAGKVFALRSQTPKHSSRGGWSHYTVTSEPVVGYGANVMVTVQSGIRTSDLVSFDH
jgi:hypothetical protein